MLRVALMAGLLLLASSSCGARSDQDPAPQPGQWPPAGGTELPLWPEGLAIAKPETTEAEKVVVGKKPIAGKPVTAILNVSRPTMTVFPAKGRNSGAALLVFPGGGYQALAVDLEGTEVCDWATARGITCVVLKYRVPQAWWHKDCHCQYPPKPQMALQDAQRAMGLLRERAAGLGVDPHKIGVLGFSAGGHLVAAISNAGARIYDSVDAADKQSARPDFAVALYPGHLWSGDDGTDKGAILYSWDTIRSDAPPTLIVQAEDDPVDDVRHSVSYFLALRAAKVPVEMHIYAEGGHAFGLRETAMPITRWPELAEKWLGTIGIFPKSN